MISNQYYRLAPLINYLAGYLTWIHPNILSLVAVLLSLPGAYLLMMGNLWGGIWLIAATVLDSLDGAVARLTHRTSAFGGILDATLDRLMDSLLLFSLSAGGFVPWWLSFLTITLSYTVSYIKAKAEAALALSAIGRNPLSVGLAERTERLIIIIIGVIVAIALPSHSHQILFITIAIVALLSAITILWRGYAIYQLAKIQQ